MHSTKSTSSPSASTNNSDVGHIVLLTKVKCPDCEKFKPEWIKFMEYFERFHAHRFPINFIQHRVYDASATNAVEKRKEILQFAEEGVDNYPVLLFYIVDSNSDDKSSNTNESHRWKPYWFNAAPFRTASALIFSFLVLFRIASSMHKALAAPNTPTLGQESKMENEKSEREKIEEGRQYLQILPQLRKDLQAEVDTHYTDKDRAHPNYPTFDKVFTLYVPAQSTSSSSSSSTQSTATSTHSVRVPHRSRPLVSSTSEPERAPTQKELEIANSY